MTMTDARRGLPSVHALINDDLVQPLLDRAPRSLVTDAARHVIEQVRRDPSTAPRDSAAWAAAVAAALADRERPSLRPAYNATGIVLHTNLGRAPLADVALRAISETAAGYCNLEYDVERGARGSRYDHCVQLLRELTGAEDALVVNNCAAALVLGLNTVSDGREAIVSRGELIEIGGSFRVPEIMAKSGARLVEVGTTNRTHVNDYAAAIRDETGAIVKVHRSNFTIEGFVAEATVRDLAGLARDRGTPLIYDFGSGLLLALDHYGLAGEPTVADAVRDGASITVMSGDKLLGGPQAGIIVGDAMLIARLRRNPLLRALRVDKLTIAALEATLALYRDPERAVRLVPTLAMLTAPGTVVRSRATAVCDALRTRGIEADVIASVASVGGGAFPTARIPSAAVSPAGAPVVTEARLRLADPSVIGRIVDDRVLLDLRSVPARDDAGLTAAVIAALG
jgi:L-seryl-tRNA(Ser) seleniumtransferase